MLKQSNERVGHTFRGRPKLFLVQWRFESGRLINGSPQELGRFCRRCSKSSPVLAMRKKALLSELVTVEKWI
jgi:hypothetical protein